MLFAMILKGLFIKISIIFLIMKSMGKNFVVL